MASQSWVYATCPINFNFGGATWYNSLTGIQDGEDQPHSQVRVPPGQFSTLTCVARSITGTVTVTSNKNNAAGNQSVSVIAAGVFQDLTHTDTVLNGDKFCTKIVGATFVELTTLSYLFDTSFNSGSGNATVWMGQGSTSSGNNAGGYFGCGLYTDATEANCQLQYYSAGTLSNIQVWETNGFQTFTARVNGTNTSLAVISPAGIWADDNAHTVSVSANDLVSYGVNSTSTERTYNEVMRFVSSNGGFEVGGAVTGSGNINITTFSGLVWTGNGLGIEADWESPTPYQLKMTEMRVDIFSPGGTGTMTMRKNGASATASISWGGTVGLYIDNVSSDTFNAGDKHAFEYVPNSAANLGLIAVHIAPGVSTETATVSLAIGNPQFNVAAQDTSFVNKSVNLAIGKMNFNITTSRKETGAALISIPNLQFNVRESKQETVSASIAIGGPLLAVQVLDLSALNKLRQFTIFG